MGADMTFAEVPVGHIFRFKGCACVCRRINDRPLDYTYVTRCPEHVGAYALGGLASMSAVEYDPLVAMLEAQSREGPV